MMRAIALTTLALSACVPTSTDRARMELRAIAAQADLEAALAGLTPGRPTSCLPLTGRQNYSVEGHGSTILYKVGRKLVYRNDTTGGCEGIARGDILVTVQPIGRRCSGDIATTVDNVSRIQTGSCGLGAFVPYRAR